MTDEALLPERYGPGDAEVLLLTWGSTYGPGREAVDLLADRGVSAAMLHFAQLWPIRPAAVIEAIGRPKRIVSVEGNQTGQLAAVLRQAEVPVDCELISRYDGLPFTGEEIAARVRS